MRGPVLRKASPTDACVRRLSVFTLPLLCFILAQAHWARHVPYRRLALITVARAAVKSKESKLGLAVILCQGQLSASRLAQLGSCASSS